MREIKFKAKNINGLWVVGDLSVVKNKSAGVDPGYYISNSAGMPFAFRVIGESIGQYTGLKDINGVEIYEGDILKGTQNISNNYNAPHEILGLVRYSERNTLFYLDDSTGRHDLFATSLGCSIYQYEVAGNQYNNPELLPVNGVIE